MFFYAYWFAVGAMGIAVAWFAAGHLPWAGVIMAGLACLYALHVSTSSAQFTSSNDNLHVRKHPKTGFLARYFNIQLLTKPALTAAGQYLFGIHPHGVHANGCALLQWYGSELYNDKFPAPGPDSAGRPLTIAVASIVFKLPIARELFLRSGYRDCSKASLQRQFKEGANVGLVVGGEAESLLTEPNTDKLVLNKRLGFVKLALDAGVELVPTYCFGNTDVFSTSSVGMRLRQWLVRAAQICIVVFWGRWGTALPYPHQLGLAVGDPVPHPENWSRHEDGSIPPAVVQAYHAAYVAALQALFEKHKTAAGYAADRKLEIVL